MIRRWSTRFVIALGGLALVVVLLAAWLVGSASGTRWLVARSAAYLPQALTFESFSGSLLGGLEVRGLQWRDSTAQVSVDDVFLSLRLSPLFSRHVEITSLDLSGVMVQLAENRPASESTEPFAIDLPARISIASLQLSDLTFADGASEQRIDRVSLAGAIEGAQLEIDSLRVQQGESILAAKLSQVLRPPYTTDLDADWQFAGLTEFPLSGVLRASGDADALSVTHELTAPAAVRTEATLELSASEPAVTAVTEWAEWSLPLADGQILDTRGGRLGITGWTDSFLLNARVETVINDWPAATVELAGQGSIESFDAQTLRVVSDAGELLANGTVDWRNGLQWIVDFELANGQPDYLSESLGGSIDAVGVSGGLWQNGKLQSAQLDVERLSGTLNNYPIEGALQSRFEGDLVTVDALDLRVRDNEVKGSGTLIVSEQRVAGQAEWSAPALGALHGAAAGSSSGRLVMQGTPTAWGVETAIAGNELRWNEIGVAALNINGSFGSGGSGNMTLDAGSVDLGDREFETLAIAIDGGVAEHDVVVEAQASGVNAQLNAVGSYIDDAWQGSLQGLSAVGDALGQWSLDAPATVAISGDEIALGKLCITEREVRGTACLALNSLAGGAVSIDGSIDGLPLTALPISIPPNVNVDGQLEATISATRNGGFVNGEVDVQLVGASASGQYDGDTVEVAPREARLSARIENSRLIATGGLLFTDDLGRLNIEVDVEDVLAADTPLTANADIAINDLSFMPLFVPEVSAASGQLNGMLRLTGSLAQPAYRGSVELAAGAFTVPAAGIGVSEMNVTISQSQPGRLQLRGIARSGEGRVSVTGFTQLAGGEDISAELRINGENFEVVRLPNWQATASPAVLVQVDRERTRVTGQIAIPSADINLEGLPETADVPSEDTFVHGRDDAELPPGRISSIDLQATLGDDVKLAGFGLTTGLTGAVRLRGVSNSPLAGLGRLDLVDGRYKAYGQELEIEQGALVFNGPLENPVLDVRAVRRIDDILAGLSLAGTPRTPQSTLYSEPDLSDAEILSYLITGRPLRSASAGEGEILGQAAFALGLTGAGAIATQVGNTLGLDTLAVDGSGGSGRIVAGKRLGDRLLVEYGYGLVDKLGTLLLRYELNDKVVIESSTGSVSALDVVYSIKRN